MFVCIMLVIIWHIYNFVHIAIHNSSALFFKGLPRVGISLLQNVLIDTFGLLLIHHVRPLDDI